MRRVDTPYEGFCTVERWDVGGPHFHEVVRASDSVSGLLWCRETGMVLLVRQRRAPMVRDDNPDGIIVELVAGRCDKDKGPKAIFVDEAWEEAGARISEADVELLNHGRPLALSPGIMTEHAYLAFAEIGPEHLTEGDTFGLAEDGEETTRVWISFEDFLTGPHEDLRVFTLARELENRLLLERITELALRLSRLPLEDE